jgi:3-isopropylmalate/(R)-2-methylmalate dehydratase small subunit
VEPFVAYSGKIAVLNLDDLDTDRIIPARFLSRIARQGYGELLFHDMRGSAFPLDAQEAAGATILVTGSNFGCGSSREHAVWAIQQAGYRAVIAKKTAEKAGFSDIFRQNAANCGLLLIELNEADFNELASAGSGTTASIDLQEQVVLFGTKAIRFDIAPATKAALVEGMDLIGTTLVYNQDISEYEERSGPFVPPHE